MSRESLTSRRISVVNQSTKELYDLVTELSEALMDRDQGESLHKIVELGAYVKSVKEQIVNGDLL